MSAGADEAKARRAAEGMATSDQDFRKQFGELRDDISRCARRWPIFGVS